MKKKLLKRMVLRCQGICRWFSYYRKRVRMIEAELGSTLEAC